MVITGKLQIVAYCSLAIKLHTPLITIPHTCTFDAHRARWPIISEAHNIWTYSNTSCIAEEQPSIIGWIKIPSGNNSHYIILCESIGHEGTQQAQDGPLSDVFTLNHFTTIKPLPAEQQERHCLRLLNHMLQELLPDYGSDNYAES